MTTTPFTDQQLAVERIWYAHKARAERHQRARADQAISTTRRLSHRVRALFEDVEILSERLNRAVRACARYRAESAEMAAELGRVSAELTTTQAELGRIEPALCADCGHLRSAHYDATEHDVSGCNASGAKVRACTCWYFIPFVPAAAVPSA